MHVDVREEAPDRALLQRSMPMPARAQPPAHVRHHLSGVGGLTRRPDEMELGIGDRGRRLDELALVLLRLEPRHARDPQRPRGRVSFPACPLVDPDAVGDDAPVGIGPDAEMACQPTQFRLRIGQHERRPHEQPSPDQPLEAAPRTDGVDDAGCG